jgi:hypothetical protein
MLADAEENGAIIPGKVCCEDFWGIQKFLVLNDVMICLKPLNLGFSLNSCFCICADCFS